MELDPGEVICDCCNGKGRFCFTRKLHVTKHYCNSRQCFKTSIECPGHNFQPCPKCRGTGKLDWIENITGKKGVYYLR